MGQKGYWQVACDFHAEPSAVNIIEVLDEPVPKFPHPRCPVLQFASSARDHGYSHRPSDVQHVRAFVMLQPDEFAVQVIDYWATPRIHQ